MEPDVLAVGSGSSGHVVSMQLAHQSYRGLLVDRTTFLRDKTCAEYLSLVLCQFLILG
jgi:flavin-dependent dehydrogenase